MASPITVLIVADIRLFREGLADILGRDLRIKVIGAVARLDEALDGIARWRPEVVLLDMARDESGADLSVLAHHEAGCKIVLLDVDNRGCDLVACVREGATGFVSRDDSLEDLLAAILGATRGEHRCSAQTSDLLYRRLAPLASALGGRRLDRLTQREREILELLEDGLSNKEIAGRLGIEVPTVKNHIHNLLEKLQVHRRSEAVARVRTRRELHQRI